jgi:hypothetical protein
MEIQLILGIISGVIATMAYIPYILSVVNGKTKPNRASWGIWAVLGIIICASYWSVGARDTFWFTLPIGMITTALLSLRYGVGGWTTFDKFCLLGAAVGLLLWWVSGIPFTALAVASVIDMMGFFPTLKKVWDEPTSEDKLAWAMFFVAAALNVTAIDRWTLEIAAYPVYILIFNTLVLAFLLRGSDKKKILG